MHQRQIENVLLIFARYPQAGKTKTRLIPAYGPDGAATIYANMLSQILDLVRPTIRDDFKAVILVEPPDCLNAMQELAGFDFEYATQTTGSLGDRLNSAFAEAFKNGAKKVLAIGTDCVEITTDIIAHAVNALKSHDAVIGPASDGGYYLIGLGTFLAGLFAEISWSTEHTLAQTMERLRSYQFSIFLLPELSDIDTPEDVKRSMLKQIAKRVVELKLEAPTVLFLELHKPISSVIYNASLFVEPLAKLVIGKHRVKHLQAIFAERENVEELISFIHSYSKRATS